jgi:hypothetical protein
MMGWLRRRLDGGHEQEREEIKHVVEEALEQVSREKAASRAARVRVIELDLELRTMRFRAPHK